MSTAHHQTEPARERVDAPSFTARAIRHQLRKQNRTQQWLAAEAQLSPRTMARRLDHRAPTGFRMDELQAVARALRVNGATLLPDVW